MEQAQTSPTTQVDSEGIRRRGRDIITGLFWAAAFAVAYTQSPLYFSNQHQYFLHGLADGGLGHLDRDWLARTADPTPVFTALVAFTYRHLHPYLFHVYYFALLGLYFYCLTSLGAAVTGRRPTGLTRLGLFTALIALHAAIPRVASVRWWGVDYPWYFQCGVAGQYVLGTGLQPSAFGVLLVAALAAFDRGRLVLTAVCAAAAAVFHATYLLPVALFTVAFMFQLARERRPRAALFLGVGTLLAVAPVVAYHARTFAPTSAATFAEAQRILVQVRIPHHAIVGRWLDTIAVLQLAWIAFGFFLIRRTRLFPVLAVVTLLSALLTLVQVFTGNDTLALLFPWRVSAVLVPVATASVLFRLFARLAPWLDRQAGWSFWGLRVAGSAALAGLVLGGVAVNVYGLGYRMNPDEVPLLEYVAAHQGPDDVYLLPVAVPKVGSGPKGSVSLTFTPPPRPRTEKHLIPVDFQRFRLATGAPAFVDFKSIPYRDAEVTEWYARLLTVQDWYARGNWGRPEVREALARHGITHVITTADHGRAGGGLEPVYADDNYQVYRVVRAGR